MNLPKDLVNPNDYGIKSGIIWWATIEAKTDYGVTDEELKAIGITSKTLLISKKLISDLQKINETLKEGYGLELIIDDGYRSPELYNYAAKKVAEKKGQKASNSLFNLNKMPHALGTSVDVGLVDLLTGNRVKFFDQQKDGIEASFLGYYDQFDDAQSKSFVVLQKLIGKVFLANNFQYGSKKEVWHFDFKSNMFSIRTSATQIPSFDELSQIMLLESKRQRPKSKQTIEYGDYSSILKLCNYFNIETNIFTVLKPTIEYLPESTELKNILINKILDTLKGEIKDKALYDIFNQMYDYLSEYDELKSQDKFDTIFVFGSASILRIQKAIELYHTGFSKSITISGHKPFYKDRADTEAEYLADYAVGLGVEKKNIIIENQAISLPDNVKRTLDLWKQDQKIQFKPGKIIIVTSPFSMRRGYIEWQKFPDYPLQINRQCSNVSVVLNQDNWYKTESSLNIILNEFIKIRGEYLIDLTLAGIISETI